MAEPARGWGGLPTSESERTSLSLGEERTEVMDGAEGGPGVWGDAGVLNWVRFSGSCDPYPFDEPGLDDDGLSLEEESILASALCFLCYCRYPFSMYVAVLRWGKIKQKDDLDDATQSGRLWSKQNRGKAGLQPLGDNRINEGIISRQRHFTAWRIVSDSQATRTGPRNVFIRAFRWHTLHAFGIQELHLWNRNRRTRRFVMIMMHVTDTHLVVLRRTDLGGCSVLRRLCGSGPMILQVPGLRMVIH